MQVAYHFPCNFYRMVRAGLVNNLSIRPTIFRQNPPLQATDAFGHDIIQMFHKEPNSISLFNQSESIFLRYYFTFFTNKKFNKFFSFLYIRRTFNYSCGIKEGSISIFRCDRYNFNLV